MRRPYTGALAPTGQARPDQNRAVDDAYGIWRDAVDG